MTVNELNASCNLLYIQATNTCYSYGHCETCKFRNECIFEYGDSVAPVDLDYTILKDNPVIKLCSFTNCRDCILDRFSKGDLCYFCKIICRIPRSH